MPNYSADEFIGKNLVAKANVTAYSSYPKSSKTKTISSGSVIGKVYSWIKDPDNAANIYWAFNEPYGTDKFYVKHDVNKIGLYPDETVESLEDKKKREAEQKKKEDMGDIPYYLEKYGKPLLLLAGAGLAVKAYTVYSGKKKQ